MYFHTWMSFVLFSLFVSLRNLYISLKSIRKKHISKITHSFESIRKRHISKITHSFKFSLYSSNDNKKKKKKKKKRETKRQKTKKQNKNKLKKTTTKKKQKKNNNKKQKNKTTTTTKKNKNKNRPYAESNHVRTKVSKCVYLSNHYNLCATINHCQGHSTKRYSISILMKNTGCSLERTGGG